MVVIFSKHHKISLIKNNINANPVTANEKFGEPLEFKSFFSGK